MMKRLVSFVCFMICLFLTLSVTAASVSDIRIGRNKPNVVRLVAELSEKTEATVFRLMDPSRLVIDFKKTNFEPAMKTKRIPTMGFITGLRFGQPNPDTARIVLDLPNQTLTESHFLLPPETAKKPWRFVMDISSDTTVSVQNTPKQSTFSATAKSNVGLQPFSGKKRQKIIVLDPGHGGQDPGAISKSGNYEKHLTLKMAKEAKTLLEKAGYKVVLTRDKDIYITLRGRIQKAHKANADLFISIHADSAANSSARGLSVYTISERASDVEAAALAERENKADIIFGMDLGDYQPEVGNILIDLAKRDTMEKSAKYATALVKEMKKNVKLVPNAHRFAGFVVLKSPTIPSVLMEMGYLSNRTEERNLQKQSYRKKLAEAMVKAVNSYFEEIE